MTESSGEPDSDDNSDPVSNRITQALGFSLHPQPSSPTHDLTEPITPKYSLLKPWLITATAGCIAAFLCFVALHQLKKNDKSQAMNVLFTRNKSHSNLQLPDGTLVVLNENSRISYNADFGQSKREIVLEGEAYFDVAKNAETPLIVHAGNVDIKVLGTTFNVKAYPKDKNIETSLFKGAIEVSSKRFPKQKVLLRPNEKIAIPTLLKDSLDELVPEENIANIPDTPQTHPQPVDDTSPTDTLSYHLKPLRPEHTSHLIPEIAWIYRKLAFNQEPLESVAEKMEKFYDVNIYFEDDDLKKQTFTGSFSTETLEEALKALQYSYHFSFIIKKKEVFIKRK